MTWSSGGHMTWSSGGHVTWSSSGHVTWSSSDHVTRCSGGHVICLLYAGRRRVQHRERSSLAKREAQSGQLL